MDEEEKFQDLPVLGAAPLSPTFADTRIAQAPDDETAGAAVAKSAKKSGGADSKRNSDASAEAEAYGSDADDTDDEAVKRGPSVRIKSETDKDSKVTLFVPRLAANARVAQSASASNSNSNSNSTAYDPRKRDPLFANAKYSCLWELSELSMHFHPSVAKFSRILLSGDHVAYAGDPLKDFTSVAFLDRFVYRNPKASAGQKTGSHVLRSRKEVCVLHRRAQTLQLTSRVLRRLARITWMRSTRLRSWRPMRKICLTTRSSSTDSSPPNRNATHGTRRKSKRFVPRR